MYFLVHANLVCWSLFINDVSVGRDMVGTRSRAAEKYQYLLFSACSTVGVGWSSSPFIPPLSPHIRLPKQIYKLSRSSLI